MKLFLLIASALALVANGAYAQEYRGTEDNAIDELPSFLRGSSSNGQCNCNSSNDCPSNKFCEAGDCAVPYSGFAYSVGRCVSFNNGGAQCNCNSSNDCPSNQFCEAGSCAVPYSGFAYDYGRCVSDNNRGTDRACNYKQCTNKSNGSCECQSGESCVKGNESGANTCTTTDDLNGCCVPFVALDGSGEEE